MKVKGAKRENNRKEYDGDADGGGDTSGDNGKEERLLCKKLQ
jgi:hypothetical protein